VLSVPALYATNLPSSDQSSIHSSSLDARTGTSLTAPVGIHHVHVGIAIAERP
jgi:hypothetical protein